GVGQYMIGFGPRLWSRRFGETEYGVKALPLGGFISMSGMYPPSDRSGPAKGLFASLVQDARAANDETIAAGSEERVFYRLPVWKRIIVRSEEHTSELQSRENLVCRLLLEK